MAKKTEHKRLMGAVVPVGALRSRENTAVGEYLDLIEFAGLCKEMGIGLIQILPVNDTGYQSSPYFALTAFALHPLYIRLSELEEAEGFKEQAAELGKKFGGESRFHYYHVLRAKMELLREMYAAHEKAVAKDAESGGLAKWIAENPWVRPYAVFRRLKEANSEKSWKEWETVTTGSEAEIDAFWSDPQLRKEHLFWAWLQRVLDSQFGRAAKAIKDMGILLEGDLPILMNDDSCDVWSNKAIFKLDLSAGAPPDMYSPEGQNWGFPIYNWPEHIKDNYAWWKSRLKIAEKYYGAYRIDHVLGFFRIWTSVRAEISSVLGRFIPSVPVTRKDLEKLDFDNERIRWISRPHIPTGELWDAIRRDWPASEPEIANEAGRAFTMALDRIDGEELWLFKDSIRGEKDIYALGLQQAAAAFLVKAWQNRLLFEYEKDSFSPVWYYRESRAYYSLSETERSGLEALLEKRKIESEKIWEKEGLKLLTVLTESSGMLPCAEDLGAVPDCVPLVLAKLNILGLRVIRWFRRWEEENQPYVPVEDYPELSVCTPSVHDSSTLREWWDTEADQGHFAGFIGVPSLPKVYNPGTAKIFLKQAASAASRFRVFQIQDLLHLSEKWYAADPASERINVPGSDNEFNWTYRLPAPIEDIRKDSELINNVRKLSKG